MGVGAVVTSANWVALCCCPESQVVNCDAYILPAPATLWEWSVRLWEVPTHLSQKSVSQSLSLSLTHTHTHTHTHMQARARILIYHASCLCGVLHKYFPSVSSTLQPLKLR
jgi:hypothetical protein